jgi:hypothetical protein
MASLVDSYGPFLRAEHAARLLSSPARRPARSGHVAAVGRRGPRRDSAERHTHEGMPRTYAGEVRRSVQDRWAAMSQWSMSVKNMDVSLAVRVVPCRSQGVGS